MKWQDVAKILLGILVIAGGLTYSDLFGALFQLNGIEYTHTGDITCDSTCESYINITTSYWRVCFEHTADDQRMYIPGDSKLSRVEYQDYPDTVLYKKANYGRTLWVNLNNVDNIITTDPDIPVDWMVPTYGNQWRDVKDGDCWDRGKVNKIKLVGHKEVWQDVKWSFITGEYVDIDPFWVGENDDSFWINNNRYGIGGSRDIGGHTGSNVDENGSVWMDFRVPESMNITDACIGLDTTFNEEDVPLRFGITTVVSGQPDYGDNFSDYDHYMVFGSNTFGSDDDDDWVCFSTETYHLLSPDTSYRMFVTYNESNTFNTALEMRNGYAWNSDGGGRYYADGFKGSAQTGEDHDIFDSGEFGPTRMQFIAFAFKTTEGYFGHPQRDNYYFDGDYPNIFDDNIYAQIFTPVQQISPKNISTNLYRMDGDMYGYPVTGEIRNSSNDIVTSCEFDDVTVFQTCTLSPDNIILEPDTDYYFTLSCYDCDHDSDSSTWIMKGGSVDKYNEDHGAPDWIANATGGGYDSYMVYSSNNGSTWSDRDGKRFDDLSFEMGFASNDDNAPPVTTGDFSSTSIFSGDTVNFTGTFNRTPLVFGDANLSHCWYNNGTVNSTPEVISGTYDTCFVEKTFTGVKDDSWTYTWYANDTKGNIGSSSDTVSIVVQQYDVTDVTQTWIRYDDALYDDTVFTATYQANYINSNPVNFSFKVNGTEVCSNSTTISDMDEHNISCTYTTENNIGIAEVCSNYTGSDCARLIGVWKEHPYFMGTNYTLQDEILSDTDHPWNSLYTGWKNDCNDYDDYNAGWGYWRGNTVKHQAYCYQMTGNTDFSDRVAETIVDWCGRTKTEIDSAGQDSLFVLGAATIGYDLIAETMNESQRLATNDCFYKWAGWYYSSTGVNAWVPTNGQGFELARSLPAIIGYGETNSYDDPYWTNESQDLEFWLSSSYDFIYGFLNGSIAWDGARYQTYGFDIGQYGFATSRFEYPNEEPIDAAQGTACEWYNVYLYSIIKANTQFNGDYLRKIGYKEATEYGDNTQQKPSEFAFASGYCKTDQDAVDVGAWLLNFQNSNTNEYNGYIGVQTDPSWIDYAKADTVSKTPQDVDLDRVWKDNQANGAYGGMVIARTGWDTVNQSSTAEDTVVMGMTHDVGSNGHAHEDDNSIFVYVGGVDGGEEIFTDGSGRRANEDEHDEDYKAASTRHNVLIVDDKQGGWWGDGGRAEPVNTRMFLPTSNGNGIGHSTLWIGQTEAGGLSRSEATGWPDGQFNDPDFTGRIFHYDTDLNLTSYRMSKPFWNGVSGEYINHSRYVAINYVEEGNMIILYETIQNPTTSTHEFETNWLVAHPNGESEDYSEFKDGYLFENSVANAYIAVPYARDGYTWELDKVTAPRGIYQVSDTSYDSYTENRIHYGTGLNNFSSIVFIEPFTDAEGSQFNIYKAELIDDVIKVRILGATQTYEYNFSTDLTVPMSYAQYDTVVPFITLLTPEASVASSANYADSSTVNFTCNISSSNYQVSNLSLILDDVINDSVTGLSGSSYLGVFEVSGLTDGTHTWSCVGYDNQGEVSNQPSVRTLIVDTTFTTMTIVAPEIDELRPLINISTNELVQYINYSMDNSSWIQLCTDCSGSADTYETLGEGSNTIYTVVSDYANNVKYDSYQWNLDLNGTFTDTYSSNRYISDSHETRDVADGEIVFFNPSSYTPFTSIEHEGTTCWMFQAEDYHDMFNNNSFTDNQYWEFRTTDVPDDTGLVNPWSGTGFMQQYPLYASTYGDQYSTSSYPNMTCLDYYADIPAGTYVGYTRATNPEGSNYNDYNKYNFGGSLFIDESYVVKMSGNHDGFTWRQMYSPSTSIAITGGHKTHLQFCQSQRGVKFDAFIICENTLSISATEIPTSSSKDGSNQNTGNFTSIQLNTSTNVDNITATWDITGSSSDYTVEVTADGTNWNEVSSSGTRVDVTDGDNVQYRVLFDAADTVTVESITLTFDGDEQAPTGSPSLSLSYGDGVPPISWRVLFYGNTYAYNQMPTQQNSTNPIYWAENTGDGCGDLQMKLSDTYTSVDTEAAFMYAFSSYINLTTSYQTIGEVCDGETQGIWLRRQYYEIPEHKTLDYNFQFAE